MRLQIASAKFCAPPPYERVARLSSLGAHRELTRRRRCHLFVARCLYETERAVFACARRREMRAHSCSRAARRWRRLKKAAGRRRRLNERALAGKVDESEQRSTNEISFDGNMRRLTSVFVWLAHARALTDIFTATTAAALGLMT